jgi:hypothetical protein
MTSRELLRAFENKTAVTLDLEGHTGLLESAILVREEDTRMSGWIRILEWDGVVLIQEETRGGEILVRKMATLEDADTFVKDRLDTYERMWDGCGCKVDYYA